MSSLYLTTCDVIDLNNIFDTSSTHVNYFLSTLCNVRKIGVVTS